MIAVATGGSKIQELNSEYKRMYKEIAGWLSTLSLENPNPYKDLLDWYGRWKQDDLCSYQLRREFISSMYKDLLNVIDNSVDQDKFPKSEPTGWERVDRSIFEMKKILAEALNEEQFQTIGTIARETFVTIAQQVYDQDKYPSTDGVKLSTTDGKRMLESFFAVELKGHYNESTRKYAKATMDLANSLTHNRSATKEQAWLTLISIISLANIVRIVAKANYNAFDF